MFMLEYKPTNFLSSTNLHWPALIIEIRYKGVDGIIYDVCCQYKSNQSWLSKRISKLLGYTLTTA